MCTIRASANEQEVDEYVFWADSYEDAVNICNARNADLVEYGNGVGVLKLSQIPEGAGDQEVLQSYGEESSEPEELYPNYCYEIQTEDDAGISLTDNQQWHIPLFKMEEVFSISRGKGARVAIIDSGIDMDNPSLSGGIIYAGSTIPEDAYGGTGYSILYMGPQDYTGHGTHVAGIIRANGSDPSVVGMAPECSIISIKALEKNGNSATGYTSWIARAVIEAVDQGADIINMSLGGSKRKDVFLSEALEIAQNSGVTVVCAAGNYMGSGIQGMVDYPASDSGTLAVSAIKSEGVDLLFDLSYSKYGDMVSISAPGTGILSLEIGGGVKSMNGTSMACAVVSGEAALIKAYDPGISPNRLKELITSNTLDLGNEGFDIYYGHGMIQPLKALEVIKNEREESNPPTEPDNSEGSKVEKNTEDTQKETEQESQNESESDSQGSFGQNSSDQASSGQTTSDQASTSGAAAKAATSDKDSAQGAKEAEDVKKATVEKDTKSTSNNMNTSNSKAKTSADIEKDKKELLEKLDEIDQADEIKYTAMTDDQTETVKNDAYSALEETSNENIIQDKKEARTWNPVILIIPGIIVISIIIIAWLRRKRVNEKQKEL